jgi:drug/metabolite transporter (DMT)-like permease
MQKPTNSESIRGAVYGLAAVSIWAAFIVVARLGLRTSLSPWDIAAVRFAVAGSLLLPYILRKGFALERLGWIGLAAIVIGCGAPMVLLANAGLMFAPAAHAGALFPGVMPLMVAILAAAILNEPVTSRKRIGLVLILAGGIGIVWGAGGTLGTEQNLGHVLFLAAGLAWACYTVAMRRARLDGLHAAGTADPAGNKPARSPTRPAAIICATISSNTMRPAISPTRRSNARESCAPRTRSISARCAKQSSNSTRAPARCATSRRPRRDSRPSSRCA